MNSIHTRMGGLFLSVIFNFVCSNSGTLAQKDFFSEVIRMNFLNFETHNVQTKDGYVLTVHRVPALAANNTNNTAAIKRPVILMHGLMGSSTDFLLAGKDRALGVLLHDQGYDIWLPNARGTTYSKKHLAFDSSQPDFWNFSWHEIGTQDLPAVVDYILNFTNESSLHYIAHSQGCTAFFVMLSEMPQYNEKIISGHLLAPVAFLKDIRSPPLRLMALENEKLDALLNHLGLHELFPSTALNQLGGHLFCGKGVPTQNLCVLLTFISVGFSDFQMDRTLFPRIFETTPAGISRKQFLHFGQLIISGKFQQYDYKSKNENYRHYKSKTPPEYNLCNVRVPLQLFYGSHDLVMSKQDVFRLMEKLKNTHYSSNEIQGFNHIDMLYSTEAPRLIYKKIIREIKNFYK